MEISEKAIVKLGLPSIIEWKDTPFPYQNQGWKTYGEFANKLSSTLRIRISETIVCNRKITHRVELHQATLGLCVAYDTNRSEAYKKALRKCYRLLKRYYSSNLAEANI